MTFVSHLALAGLMLMLLMPPPWSVALLTHTDDPALEIRICSSQSFISSILSLSLSSRSLSLTMVCLLEARSVVSLSTSDCSSCLAASLGSHFSQMPDEQYLTTKI